MARAAFGAPGLGRGVPLPGPGGFLLPGISTDAEEHGNGYVRVSFWDWVLFELRFDSFGSEDDWLVAG